MAQGRRTTEARLKTAKTSNSIREGSEEDEMDALSREYGSHPLGMSPPTKQINHSEDDYCKNEVHNKKTSSESFPHTPTKTKKSDCEHCKREAIDKRYKSVNKMLSTVDEEANG